MRNKGDFFDKIEMPIEEWSHRHTIMNIIDIIWFFVKLWVLFCFAITMVFGVVGAANTGYQATSLHNGVNFTEGYCSHAALYQTNESYNTWENLVVPITTSVFNSDIWILFGGFLLFFGPSAYRKIKFLYRSKKENL